MMSNQRLRYFTSNEEKTNSEAAGEPAESHEDQTKEAKTSQESARQEKRAKTGGSFWPVVGGLAILGGAALMMPWGGSNAEGIVSQKEEKKEAAGEPKPTPKSTTERSQAERATIQYAVDGEPDLADVEILDAESLEDGTMMELKVGAGEQDKVLITRYEGKLHAVGAFCTHFGAPLANGVLFDDKVLCPWHAAGFNVTSGALEYSPGIDGLPKYAVHEKDGRWFVRVPRKLEKK